MECQSCHGSLTTLADPARKGWLDEPNCQACHTGTATSNSGQIVYTFRVFERLNHAGGGEPDLCNDSQHT